MIKDMYVINYIFKSLDEPYLSSETSLNTELLSLSLPKGLTAAITISLNIRDGVKLIPAWIRTPASTKTRKYRCLTLFFIVPNMKLTKEILRDFGLEWVSNRYNILHNPLDNAIGRLGFAIKTTPVWSIHIHRFIFYAFTWFQLSNTDKHPNNYVAWTNNQCKNKWFFLSQDWLTHIIYSTWNDTVLFHVQELYAMLLNSPHTGQNGRNFADDIFKCIFLNENFCILIRISLKFISKGPIENKWALVKTMSWCRTGDKPLSGPILTQSTDTYMRHYGDELTQSRLTNNVQ